MTYKDKNSIKEAIYEAFNQHNPDNLDFTSKVSYAEKIVDLLKDYKNDQLSKGEKEAKLLHISKLLQIAADNIIN